MDPDQVIPVRIRITSCTGIHRYGYEKWGYWNLYLHGTEMIINDLMFCSAFLAFGHICSILSLRNMF